MKPHEGTVVAIGVCGQHCPSFPHSWKYRAVQREWILVLASFTQIQALSAAMACFGKP